MHETDWDALFKDECELERDAIVAYLYHYSEELRHDAPLGAFHLRRAAEYIIKGKHLGT